MLKNLKTLGLAAAIAVAAPVAAMAATISGQIDIAGNVNLGTSDFSVGGNADLEDMAIVVGATGTFAAEGVTPFVTMATFTDIDFSAPGAVWSAGIFTFTATAYSNIGASPNQFVATGVVSAAGFDDTTGRLEFTAQNGQKTTGQVSFSTTTVVPLPAGLLLMGTALAGLGMTRRKKA